MGQDFFKTLPSEIIIDILSGLPIPTILHSKRVCKSWLHLLVSREFVKAHLSKSVPGMAVCCTTLSYCSDISDWEELSALKIFEFEDKLDLERHELHYNLFTKFDLPFEGYILSSIDGLVLLRDVWSAKYDLLIYNPITRDYIELDCPQDFANKSGTYGFGVSQMSGQYKVVRISYDYYKDENTQKLVYNPKFECHVYTLGVGSWRSIEPNVQLRYHLNTFGPIFLNGNLHWLAHGLNDSMYISCFDLETELFSSFSAPPLPPKHEKPARVLCILGDCLCACDNLTDGRLVIWLMKQYGDEKSWTKEFFMRKGRKFDRAAYPIKVFKDGDILIGWSRFALVNPVYFSMKTKTIRKIKLSELRSDGSTSTDVVLHTSSFLSLKSFPLEKVSSF